MMNCFSVALQLISLQFFASQHYIHRDKHVKSMFSSFILAFSAYNSREEDLR